MGGMGPRDLWTCSLLLLVACTVPPQKSVATSNRVVVLGMIHAGHRTSESYSSARLEQAVRRIAPAYVLCEIPPDRLPEAAQQFQDVGRISEPRVSRFPEYVDVLFPLTRELDFEIVPCAAWTQSMADQRTALLREWRQTRPQEMAEMDAVQAAADQLLAVESARAGRTADDPLFIHTARYDELTRQGLSAYDRLFSDDLGPGGWTHINRAHYQLIADALDRHSGEGVTVLVMFGAGHKYWILDQLRTRDDIELLDARDFFAP